MHSHRLLRSDIRFFRQGGACSRRIKLIVYLRPSGRQMLAMIQAGQSVCERLPPIENIARIAPSIIEGPTCFDLL
jgi:hypothetical protein